MQTGVTDCSTYEVTPKNHNGNHPKRYHHVTLTVTDEYGNTDDCTSR